MPEIYPCPKCGTPIRDKKLFCSEACHSLHKQNLSLGGTAQSGDWEVDDRINHSSILSGVSQNPNIYRRMSFNQRMGRKRTSG